MRLFGSFVLSAVFVCGATPGPATKTVTVREGTNIAATVSPDRKTIIVDLQGSLWSIPFQGGSAKRITDPMLEPSRPDYSPKGDLIAFQGYKGGTFHIWTMKPDGTGLRQITEGHGDDREPRFSPDGTKIAFSSDRAFKGSYDIWVVDVATGKLAQRTSAPADEFEPAWSPDGSEIAFVQRCRSSLDEARGREHCRHRSNHRDGARARKVQFPQLVGRWKEGRLYSIPCLATRAHSHSVWNSRRRLR